MKPFRVTVTEAALRVVVFLAVTAGSAGGSLAAEPDLILSRGPGNVETLEFTIDELAALPQTTVVTENEFSDGKVTYIGPLVRVVLEQLAMDQADTIRITAANDYSVDIPTSDFRDYDVILAIEADGQRLSRREKGPLWVIYPMSDFPELRDSIHNDRLIWQVVRIESP